MPPTLKLASELMYKNFYIGLFSKGSGRFGFWGIKFII
jgi:hypothetical protein